VPPALRYNRPPILWAAAVVVFFVDVADLITILWYITALKDASLCHKLEAAIQIAENVSRRWQRRKSSSKDATAYLQRLGSANKSFVDDARRDLCSFD
jgi:hypothetical protein